MIKTKGHHKFARMVCLNSKDKVSLEKSGKEKRVIPSKKSEELPQVSIEKT